MTTTTATAPPVTGGPIISAYPTPVTLPTAPTGDPFAVQLLADAYRAQADRLDHTRNQLEATITDLARHWTGTGATTLIHPTVVLQDNLTTLSAAYRHTADHLTAYATALHHAQHHHHWSLGRIAAIGAIITITAAAVIVTAGAAAPAGTIAAAELGEAIAGAETASVLATTAETAATTSLTTTATTMTTLTVLRTLALRQLTASLTNITLDLALHTATSTHLTPTDVALDAITGATAAATLTATRTALHATETFRGLTSAGQAALDTTTLTTTLTSDQGLQQYETTGQLNPTTLTENAVLTALTGGLSVLKVTNKVDIAPPAATKPPPKLRPIEAPLASGVPPAEIFNGSGNLWQHEGPFKPWGHTLQKHVGQTLQDLRVRLATDKKISAASTFTDQETAERAITDVIRRNPVDLSGLLNGDVKSIELKATLPYDCGTVLPRHGASYIGRSVSVYLVAVSGKIVVRTAFVG